MGRGGLAETCRKTKGEALARAVGHGRVVWCKAKVLVQKASGFLKG
jgi:hypothetical protein